MSSRTLGGLPRQNRSSRSIFQPPSTSCDLLAHLHSWYHAQIGLEGGMSATRAFIVRPFGVKEGIDFEEVERKLIAPALNACGTEGRTTAEITRQGNIREDMFRLLVL